jgi:uncharacterized membrane protein
MHTSGEHAAYLLWIGWGAILIECLAILLIIGFILLATLSWLGRSLSSWQGGVPMASYIEYRSTLGRILLLGLELLVAADVVRTVALEPTLSSIAGLGLLVLIRTFLSWSIVVEVEGRWPWQARQAADPDKTTV